MTNNATHQVSLDDAMHSVTAKLRAVRNSLTAEERAAQGAAFHPSDAGGDVAGHLLPAGSPGGR